MEFGRTGRQQDDGEVFLHREPVGPVPALLALAVIAELAVLPSNTWAAHLLGANSRACLTYITLIGIGPLAAFLVALRHGAPTRPGLAGAVAGLLAGAIVGTFYAAHCTDDSPLFVATWYTIAIAGLALVGAVGSQTDYPLVAERTLDCGAFCRPNLALHEGVKWVRSSSGRCPANCACRRSERLPICRSAIKLGLSCARPTRSSKSTKIIWRRPRAA